MVPRPGVMVKAAGLPAPKLAPGGGIIIAPHLLIKPVPPMPVALVPPPVAVPAPTVPAITPPSSSSLPPGWEEVSTDGGETYYFNSVSNETCWDRPKAAPVAAPAPVLASVPEPAPAPTPEPMPDALPVGWAEVTTPEGEVYYCHEKSGETSWEKPSCGAAAPAPLQSLPPPAGGCLPHGWEELKAEDGSSYYYNAEENITSWDMPA